MPIDWLANLIFFLNQLLAVFFSRSQPDFMKSWLYDFFPPLLEKKGQIDTFNWLLSESLHDKTSKCREEKIVKTKKETVSSRLVVHIVLLANQFFSGMCPIHSVNTLILNAENVILYGFDAPDVVIDFWAKNKCWNKLRINHFIKIALKIDLFNVCKWRFKREGLGSLFFFLAAPLKHLDENFSPVLLKHHLHQISFKFHHFDGNLWSINKSKNAWYTQWAIKFGFGGEKIYSKGLILNPMLSIVSERIHKMKWFAFHSISFGAINPNLEIFKSINWQ